MRERIAGRYSASRLCWYWTYRSSAGATELLSATAMVRARRYDVPMPMYYDSEESHATVANDME